MSFYVSLVSCALLTIVAACSQQGKVDVMVTNEIGHAVDDVQLEWEGEQVAVGRLAAGKSAKRVIHPHVENTLRVRYRYDGHRIICFSDAHFENHWRGSMRVKLVAGRASFSWTDGKKENGSTGVECGRDDP